MEKTIKIEIRLNKEQIQVVNKTLGICRFLWNEYLSYNAQYYNENKKFIGGYDFAVYVNNVLSIEYPWIKEASSKSRSDVLINADKALLRHFKSKKNGGNIGFPRYKKRRDPLQSYFFIKDGIRLDKSDNSYLWIPILRWIKLKERNYLTEDMIPYITSGRIVKKNDRYYVCLILQGLPNKDNPNEPYNDGMGIDLGTSTLCTVYQNGKCTKIYNPIYSRNYIECERKIRRLSQVISHKEETNMRKYGYEERKYIKKEDATKIYHTHNIKKLRKRISKLKEKQTQIMHNYIKRLCDQLVRTKPEYITIEDLDVSAMLEDTSHNLAYHIQNSRFYYFREFLTWKCREYNIELRIANRWYASSKTCSNCGHKRKKLKLNERTYFCKKCGIEIDRDDNAAINLYNTKDYTLVA